MTHQGQRGEFSRVGSWFAYATLGTMALIGVNYDSEPSSSTAVQIHEVDDNTGYANIARGTMLLTSGGGIGLMIASRRKREMPEYRDPSEELDGLYTQEAKDYLEKFVLDHSKDRINPEDL